MLNAYVFESLEQVLEISAEWLQSSTRSGLMTRWLGSRRCCIGPNLKPEVLLWPCRRDRGAYVTT